MKTILFISWDDSVNYIEGLFFSIFRELIKLGYKIKILQLTWVNKDVALRTKAKLEYGGIEYQFIHVNYKMPFKLGYPYAIVKGVFQLKKILKNNEVEYVMPRVVIPAFIFLLSFNKNSKVKLIYDSDGFPHDERVDFQNWKVTGIAYQFYRCVEFKMFHRADYILTRSEKAKDIITARAGSNFNNNKVKVIWNGRDENVFTPFLDNQRQILRNEAGILPTDHVILYVGSLGEKYLVKEMLLFFDYARKKRNAKVIILTKQVEYVKQRSALLGILIDNFVIKEVENKDVNLYMNIADVGILFHSQTFSTQSVFPIKLVEYLLSGLPVLLSAGVGDCDKIAKSNDGMFLIDNYTNESFDAALKWMERIKRDPTVRITNRNISLKYLTATITAKKIAQIIHGEG
jgi:glycosyltransferase involved in cell wall biosynthesis